MVYCKESDQKNPKYFKDGIHDMELVESTPLNEWVTENYKEFGCNLEFITDKSPEGFQFVKGFMGYGGFLRYKMDIDNF